jgi:sugar phosphate isomerase/epimerase
VSRYVAAAAAGGASSVCLSVNHPDLLDPRGASTTLAQLTDLGLSVSMGDGFLLKAGDGMDDLKRRLDLAVQLGVPFANACAFEPDESAPRDSGPIQDQLGELCRLADAAGLGVLIEFTPLSHVPSLAAAVALIEQLDQRNLQILVDTLHLARAGEGPDDLAKVDPALLGYCQLSDGPLRSDSLAAYLDEAVFERAIPGLGELPLAQLVARLPLDITISAEVPLRSLADAGVSPDERVQRILDGTRQVVARSRAEKDNK